MWQGPNEAQSDVDLVKAVPEIKHFANVKVQQIINIRSPDIKLENLLTLANRSTASLLTTPASPESSLQTVRTPWRLLIF
jgi:L-asparaginase/Glu-tRNA(Gln) amidotransferase subunit D